MEKNKNQRQPDPGQKSNRPNRQEQANRGRRERKEPEAGHGAQQTPSGDQHESAQLNKPVTNQDAQRKITNSSNVDDVMGEQETEGDRRRNERSRSYKTTEDDFLKKFRHKTPAME